MFETGLAVLGAGAATARAGAGGSGSAAPAALPPGGFMAAQAGSSGGKNPFAPTHPAGIAFWIGVGSVAAFVLLWYSLPA
ncbi:MAG: hypothetical protein M0T72_08540 [Candidatus Dormibacteraeota bacterium]|nr:hypothetical protein [Candidatus Dormibacteraeota bacterium]